MEQVNIKDLKGVLMPVADEVRMKLSTPNLPPMVETHYVALQRILSIILIFLNETEKQGEVDMNKLSKSLSVEVVRISDIPGRSRESMWPELIIKELDGLKAGQAKKIDPEVIAYQHLSSVLTRLRKSKAIGSNVQLIKRGKDFYLAKAEA